MKDQINLMALTFVQGDPCPVEGSAEEITKKFAEGFVFSVESNEPVAVRKTADQIGNIRGSDKRVILLCGPGVQLDTLYRAHELSVMEAFRAKGFVSHAGAAA